MAQPERPATADCRVLGLAPGRRLRTRVAGLFLFLPLLARLRFDDLVRQAGYPGSRMIPASGALLSLLTLKLLDKALGVLAAEGTQVIRLEAFLAHGTPLLDLRSGLAPPQMLCQGRPGVQ